MSMKYKEDPDTKKYIVPHNVRIGSGALGNTTDKLKVRKAPGHIAKKEMIPHIRGNC